MANEEIVTPLACPLTSLGDQCLAGLSRRQRVEHSTEFCWGEVMPEAVAACHQSVAHFQSFDVVKRDRRVLLSTQAAGQQIGLWVNIGFLFRDLTFVDQFLDVGVVHRANHHVRTPKVIHAGVSGVGDFALPARADQECSDGRMGLFLRSDRRQLDHQVRFGDQLLEQIRGGVPIGGESLEQLLGRQNHLVGGLSTTALAAHAVGDHAQQATGHPRMHQQGHLILLIHPVTAMDARGRGDAEALGSGIHAETIIASRFSPDRCLCHHGSDTAECCRFSPAMDHNLHSPHRQLIELRMEHADLDQLIDHQAEDRPLDELALRRLKKRRLVLRDLIARLEASLDPQEPA